MKSILAVLSLGFAALFVQGALARALPAPWCPDLALLVVVGIGLRWPGFVPGLCVAALLGYATDLLSESLMGQHALMRLLSYLTAALASRQLDLSGVLPVAAFVFGLSVVYGFGIVAISSFFVGSVGIGFDLFGSSLGHAVVNTLAAGPIVALVERVLARFSDDEVGRRTPLPMGYTRGGIG